MRTAFTSSIKYENRKSDHKLGTRLYVQGSLQPTAFLKTIEILKGCYEERASSSFRASQIIGQLAYVRSEQTSKIGLKNLSSPQFCKYPVQTCLNWFRCTPTLLEI